MNTNMTNVQNKTSNKSTSTKNSITKKKEKPMEAIGSYVYSKFTKSGTVVPTVVDLSQAICKYGGFNEATYASVEAFLDSHYGQGFTSLYSEATYKTFSDKGNCTLDSKAFRTSWGACSMVHFLNKDLTGYTIAPTPETIKQCSMGSGLKAHQKDVHDYIDRNRANLRYGLLYHMTGTGKTCTMMAIIKALSATGPEMAQTRGKTASKPVDRFIFIVPNISIQDQVIDSLLCRCQTNINARQFVFKTMKWKGVIWTEDGYPVRRAVFVTRSAMTELAQVPIMKKWKQEARDNTCVFIDEAHDIFVNGSVSAQLKDAHAKGYAKGDNKDLVSDKMSDQILLFFTSVRFCIASTATPLKSDPNDLAAYLDAMHMMTRREGEKQVAIGGIAGNVKTNESLWKTFQDRWKSHLDTTGGFISMFDEPNATNFPNANYSRLPIDIKERKPDLNADWSTRQVIQVRVTAKKHLDIVRQAQLSKNMTTLTDVTITKSAAMYGAINDLKIPKLLKTARDYFDASNTNKGPILIYSNYVKSGVNLLRKQLSKDGCSEVYKATADQLKADPVEPVAPIKLCASRRHSSGDFVYVMSILLMMFKYIEDETKFKVPGNVEHIKKMIGFDSGIMELPDIRQNNRTTMQQNSQIEFIPENVMVSLFARMFHSIHYTKPSKLKEAADILCTQVIQNKGIVDVMAVLNLLFPLLNNLQNKGIGERSLFAVIDGNTDWNNDERMFLLRMFNSEVNHDGSVIKYMVISKAGGTGIDFKNLKQVHLLDLDYAPLYLVQAAGRATRDRSLQASTKRGMGNKVTMFSYAAVVRPESAEEKKVRLQKVRLQKKAKDNKSKDNKDKEIEVNVSHEEEYKYLRTANMATFNAVVMKHNIILRANEIIRGLSMDGKKTIVKAPPRDTKGAIHAFRQTKQIKAKRQKPAGSTPDRRRPIKRPVPPGVRSEELKVRRSTKAGALKDGRLSVGAQALHTGKKILKTTSKSRKSSKTK